MSFDECSFTVDLCMLIIANYLLYVAEQQPDVDLDS